MMLQYSPFFLPLVISALITGALAAIGFRRREDPLMPPFILLMAATTLWTVCYAGQIAFADLETNIIFNSLEYPGIVTVPLAWLLLALAYTGRGHLSTIRNTLLLFIVPAISTVLAVTNPGNLYYLRYVPEIVQGAVVWNFVHGPLFLIHISYSYLLSGIAVLLIVNRFFVSPALYRRQSALLLMAAGIPLLANLIYVLGLDPVPGLDLTPFIFTVSGIIVAFGILRYQLFSIVPVAYPVVFTAIDDGIVVIDGNNRISDLNPAAVSVLPSTPGTVIGRPATGYLPPAIWAFIDGDSGRGGEILEIPVIGSDGISREIEVTCRGIPGGGGEYIGRLVILRDVTEKHKARTAIEMANRKLSLLSGITRHDMQNKLTGLSTYLELAKEEKDSMIVRMTYIPMMEKIAGVLQEEVEFTRDYQDLGASVPVWQGVPAIIRERAALFPAPLVNLEIDPNTERLEVYADPLLEKVFYNLIDNAVRYGGKAGITILVTTRIADTALILTFADDGAGIAVNDKPRLFSKGFGKNTGLGLFLSREILSITGIIITENGVPGSGARFEITVPSGGYRFS